MEQRIVLKKRSQRFENEESNFIRQQAYIYGLSEISIEFGDIIMKYAIDLLKNENLKEKNHGHLL